MFWKIISVFLVLWYLISRWQKRKMYRLAQQLKSRNISLPFIGHSYLFLGDDEDRMKALQRVGSEAIERGGLIRHWQGSKLYIMVADAAAAEVILKCCLEKDDLTKYFKVLIGNGSVFAPVHIWRPRRKILAPIFSQKNLNNFVEVFSKQSNILTNQLASAAGTGGFSIWKYLTTFTMDSVCETTLGIQVNAQLQPNQPFLNAFENCCRIDAKRVCQPWLYSDIVFKLFCNRNFKLHTFSKNLIWDFMDKVILSKWEALNINKNEKTEMRNADTLKTFLELLMDSPGNDGGCTNEELREETLVLVLAGTDTSAVGVAFTCVLLSRHIDVQDKIYEELQGVFGDSDRPVAAEDLPQLKYLEAVIKETLRLYPPVPFIIRKVEQDVTLPSGVTLVEGCGVFVSIWSIHRNPQYWGTDAGSFRPERFLENSLKHPAAFLPFSHGPRNCLGYQYAMMSMKTAIATLLRRYCILPAVTTDLKELRTKQLRVKFDIMMKDVDNFEIQLDLRK